MTQAPLFANMTNFRLIRKPVQNCCMNMQKFHGLHIEGYESLQRELSNLFPYSKEDIGNNIKSRNIWNKPLYIKHC